MAFGAPLVPLWRHTMPKGGAMRSNPRVFPRVLIVRMQAPAGQEVCKLPEPHHPKAPWACRTAAPGMEASFALWLGLYGKIRLLKVFFWLTVKDQFSERSVQFSSV